jgi:uncharacterized protein YecT (DUF1311 family)
MKAQNMWLSYRDATCVFDAPPTSGSSFSAGLEQNCRNEYNKMRIRDLIKYIDCLNQKCGLPILFFPIETGK